MNFKWYSVFLSTLLASSFLHELRVKAAAYHPVASARITRNADDECSECSDNSNGSNLLNVQVTVAGNARSNLYAIANTTARVALIIDVQCSIILLISGNSGKGVIVDLRNNNDEYYYREVLSCSDETIKECVDSLNDGLEPLLEESRGKSCEPDDETSEANIIIKYVISNLILSETMCYPPTSLKLVKDISKEFIKLLTGDLKGLIKATASVSASLPADLPGLLNILKGLATIVSATGGLESLLENGANILTEAPNPSGVGVLTLRINQIKGKADLTSLGKILSDPEDLFKLITQLGAAKSYGTTGIFRVILSIVTYINGERSLETVISTLLQYISYSAQANNQNLPSEFKESLNDLLAALEENCTDDALSDAADIVRSLIDEDLEIKGVNISAIIKVLIRGVCGDISNYLNVIVNVLLQLQPLVDIEVSLLTCLLDLLYNLNSCYGIQLLQHIGLEVKIDAATKNCTIGYILREVPTLSQLQNGDFYENLKCLPVVGDVVKAFDRVCNKDYSLESIVDSRSSVLEVILGFFQICTEQNLEISESVIVKVKASMESSTSLQFYLGIS